MEGLAASDVELGYDEAFISPIMGEVGPPTGTAPFGFCDVDDKARRDGASGPNV